VTPLRKGRDFCSPLSSHRSRFLSFLKLIHWLNLTPMGRGLQAPTSDIVTDDHPSKIIILSKQSINRRAE
jgi:hypothetical protein